MICLLPEWQASTMILRQIRDAERLFKDDLDRIRRRGDPGFDDVLVAAIKKGYRLGNDGAARGHKDIFTGQNTFQKCKQVFNSLEAWKRPFMT